MRAAVALGSNLPSRFGSSVDTLHEAIRRLQDVGEVLAVSSFYSTAPVGFLAQPDFVNGAVILQTELGPLELLRKLLSIERYLGRVRGTAAPLKGPRILDLDLLLYEETSGSSLILNDPDLILPHPEMAARAFVLQPLAEIAPAMRHPVLGLTVQQLLEALVANQI